MIRAIGALHIIMLTGCAMQPDTALHNTTAAERVLADAIEQAKARDDTRLLAMRTRRLVIPGYEHLDSQKIKAQCGVKYHSESKDTLKENDDRKQQLVQYQFAREYNLALYPYCYLSQ
ncbi:hypothetical protein J8L98_07595 [Pseudoalteromonas sp. MMG013]|uniref:hypothetical protein n=1 Tax=Pseudoalteromonas sp. MMG013 TaxID=2822687 RepID=UPI001B368CE9|nr:hypothetical protein [Pseudoalteromonas sp. MMG013]MBQ4861551.1 hypothetical protein [Pseudoalteromonas sp. MMG013]